MMRSRLEGLPSLDSSFQLVLRRTPSSRGTFASSISALGAVDDLAEVHRLPHNGAPAGLGRQEELVLVRVALGHVARHASADGPLDLLGEAVGEPFQEEHREDVVLVVAGVDLAAQDIGGSPELGLEFTGG